MAIKAIFHVLFGIALLCLIVNFAFLAKSMLDIISFTLQNHKRTCP